MTDVDLCQSHLKINFLCTYYNSNSKLGISHSIEGEFKHEVRQFEKSYDNQQAEQISLMV